MIIKYYSFQLTLKSTSATNSPLNYSLFFVHSRLIGEQHWYAWVSVLFLTEKYQQQLKAGRIWHMVYFVCVLWNQVGISHSWNVHPIYELFFGYFSSFVVYFYGFHIGFQLNPLVLVLVKYISIFDGAIIRMSKVRTNAINPVIWTRKSIP